MEDSALYAYVVIFLLIIATGLGAPIPEELPIVAAGVMVGHASADPDLPMFDGPTGATLRWWIMLPLCIVAVVIGDTFLYLMGRFFGQRLLEKKWVRKLLPDEKKKRIEENFKQYGVLVLLFARFLPTIRSPIFIMAGVSRMPYSRFVLADGIYAVPGVTLLFTLSFWFGDQFREFIVSIEREIDAVRPALILLGILLVAAYLLYHFLRHPVATGDPKEEMPLVGEIAVKLHESSASLRAAKRDSLDQKEAESERSDNDGSKQLDAAADSKLGDDSSTAIPTPKKSPEQLD